MVGSSKILTVSYGTFSCTLEGFDDPFGAMKSIAEYFRDLAADDRYFGAEPPTPDAEMLHTIAEREVQRRVETRVHADGVTLRQISADDDDFDDIGEPEATPAPFVNASADAEVEAPKSERKKKKKKKKKKQRDDSVAEKLSRIRAVVERAREAAGDEDKGEDASQASGDHFDDLIEEETRLDSAIAGLVAEDESYDDSDESLTRAEDEATDEEISVASGWGAPEFDETYEDDAELELPDADAGEDDEARDEPEDMISAAEETLAEEEDEADEDIVSEISAPGIIDAPAEPVEEVTAEAFDEPVAEDTFEAAEEIAEDDDAAAAEAEVQIEVEEAGAEETTAERDEPVAEIEDNEVVEAATSEERDETRVADAPEAETTSYDPDAPVIRPSLPEPGLADRMARVQSAEAEHGLLSEEDEDNLAAEAMEPQVAETADETVEPDPEEAPVAAEAGAPETDSHIETLVAETTAREADAEAAEVREERRSALIATDLDNEPGFNRILAETNTKMAESEGTRRRSAIAHLKAAVAATKADRLLKRDRSGEGDAEEQSRYREDLAKVVRPRKSEPRENAADKRPKPIDESAAPLMLVSAQRVDGGKAGPQDEDFAVRPRRIGAGMLALDQDARVDQDEDDEDRDFIDFAKSMGANDLPDLLEAAAAYTAFVENQPHFSRPQIMRRAAAFETEEEFTREAGLRSFGQLLRQGRIRKLQRGQFTIAETTRFRPEARIAGE